MLKTTVPAALVGLETTRPRKSVLVKVVSVTVAMVLPFTASVCVEPCAVTFTTLVFLTVMVPDFKTSGLPELALCWII